VLRGDLWTLTTFSRVHHASSVHTMLCKGGYPPFVNVVGILVHAALANDRLGKDGRCASSGVAVVGRKDVIRRSSVGIVPILVRYHAVLVPQLQLWHLLWLMSVQSVDDQHS
jgi:hypothetical protein